MPSDVSVSETLYKKFILILKILGALTSFILAALMCMALINKFEQDSLSKVVYITCIYIMIVSIEKTAKFIHKFFKKKDSE